MVTARVQSNLGFRVPGKVVERLVDTGVFVHRGQPLMRIDRTDLALAIAAQAAAVASAKALAVQTGADEARARALFSAGVIAAQSYDRFKEAADTAHAQLAEAKEPRFFISYNPELPDPSFTKDHRSDAGCEITG
jgi:multidrug efflux pump subunit AcrA (membrane-fusion protein)